MKFRALEISLGERRIGHLFQYGDITRLAVGQDYAMANGPALLSLSLLAEGPEQQTAFFLNPMTPELNAVSPGKLPAFFQNLLPEGVLRKQIALERGCTEDDHFDILAACGSDLPGNVFARPAKEQGLVETFVTQKHDSLEMSVVDEPMEEGFSLSGMQPKLSLVKDGKRFVVTRHFEGGHVIGKLPVSAYDRLPQVEHLSLELGRAAGANVCHSSLQPMNLIEDSAPLTEGRENHFLAVERFDRDIEGVFKGRLHAEDFAQVLGVDPMYKYTGGSYSDIMKVLLAFPDLGDDAALEFMRRLTVSELLGNFDMHLKNVGLLHHGDGRIELSPAYDIVAYSVYVNGEGHALKWTPGQERKQSLSPQLLRAFSNEIGMPEPRLRAVVRGVCARAYEFWPTMIDESDLLPVQKERLKAYIMGRPVMQSLVKRKHRAEDERSAPSRLDAGVP
jgi:serine/threonine-protein kinase HipA